MTKCSACGCKNMGIHQFPKDPNRRKLWEKALQRKNWKANNNSRLCYSHFKSDDYYAISAYDDNEPLAKFLRPTAIPSVFSFPKRKTLAKGQTARLGNQIQKTLTTTETPNTSIQTSEAEHASEEISNMEISQGSGNNTCKSTKERGIQVNMGLDIYGHVKRFFKDDEAIAFYTGFESYKKFQLVYSTLYPTLSKIKYYGSIVSSLSTEDQFFLTMIKLRQDRCNLEVSRFFDISQSAVSNIFITFINFMYHTWSKLNNWPEQNLVEYFTPENFKVKQKSQKSSSQELLLYCSRAYADQSDLKPKTEPEILLTDPLSIEEPESSILAIQENLSIPALSKQKSHISGITILSDGTIASKSVHINQIRALMTAYKILKSKLHQSHIPLAYKIVFICFVCCNFRDTTKKIKL